MTTNDPPSGVHITCGFKMPCLDAFYAKKTDLVDFQNFGDVK